MAGRNRRRRDLRRDVCRRRGGHCRRPPAVGVYRPHRERVAAAVGQPVHDSPGCRTGHHHGPGVLHHHDLVAGDRCVDRARRDPAERHRSAACKRGHRGGRRGHAVTGAEDGGATKGAVASGTDVVGDDADLVLTGIQRDACRVGVTGPVCWPPRGDPARTLVGVQGLLGHPIAGHLHSDRAGGVGVDCPAGDRYDVAGPDPRDPAGTTDRVDTPADLHAPQCQDCAGSADDVGTYPVGSDRHRDVHHEAVVGTHVRKECRDVRPGRGGGRDRGDLGVDVDPNSQWIAAEPVHRPAGYQGATGCLQGAFQVAHRSRDQVQVGAA